MVSFGDPLPTTVVRDNYYHVQDALSRILALTGCENVIKGQVQPIATWEEFVQTVYLYTNNNPQPDQELWFIPRSSIRNDDLSRGRFAAYQQLETITIHGMLSSGTFFNSYWKLQNKSELLVYNLERNMTLLGQSSKLLSQSAEFTFNHFGEQSLHKVSIELLVLQDITETTRVIT